MCTFDRVLFTHRVEEGGETWLHDVVYTKNTMIKRTIMIDRYTQMARGRGSAGYNIHESLRG